MKFIGAFACSILLTFALTVSAQETSRPSASPDQLIGLWKAKKRFGPDARGTLIIRKDGSSYIADMVGRRLPIRIEGNELVFNVPNGQGYFRGRVDNKLIRGHWFRPGTLVNGWGFPAVDASPVVLNPDGNDRWIGKVDPAQDEYTFYLMAEKRPDGSISVLMRNPERDMGNQIGASRLVRDGNVVRLMGKRANETTERVLSTGTFDPENEIITLFFLNRGLTYDFMRDGGESDFYRRGKDPGRYVYEAPPALNDGWKTGTLDEAGIDRGGIERMMQTLIETPENAPDTPQLHGVVIIRNGKLVFEEYFYGEHRDRLHNTRSASKSVVAVLVGAAMEAGAPLKLSTPVYELMKADVTSANPDERKHSMTLENLLMMSSGIFCDDNNDQAPGKENTVWEQREQPNFYRMYLNLPMDRKPGERSVYCSNDPNVALGMVGRAMGENPLQAFDRLIGRPMQIERYSWLVDRAGNPYGGGGTAFTLRDFAKFGQLMLDEGVWQGRRILSRDFVARSSAPHTTIGSRKYGYLWWVGDYPYKDRKVNVYWALGAGGQNISVIPELQLIIATYSGSYATRAYGYGTGELVPNLILPTVKETKAADRKE